MIVSHIVLGVSLIIFAVWLQRTEGRGWPNESSDDERDASYFGRRKRSRRRVNVILAICGGLILVAGMSGPRLFVISWGLVTMALLAVVVLAAFDVLGTRRHVNSKLPQLRQRLLESDYDDES